MNVLPDKGTGLVMCCTFGDQTISDIDWYHRHELDLKVIMDERGVWKEETGPLVANVPVKHEKQLSKYSSAVS